ncbi:MAG TPA: hypothetical protein VGQ99_12265 [Tepidisphaeraceae bacterium]|nr:hypothetical protein [Tepidisphaeraceae bacterium]
MLLCAAHQMFFQEDSTLLLEPQVFTEEQLAAAATLDAEHAAEVDAYLAAKAGGKLQAEGGIGAQTLGNIVWTNRNDSGNGFADAFGGNASMAKLVVDAAVDAWDKVIADFNWPSRDNNLAFEVHIDANDDVSCGGYADTGNDNGGIPYDGDFVIKKGSNCSGGLGWWLDSTPTENSEFLGNITQAFSMDAPNGSPARGRADLFTVVVAEMAHLLGMSDDQDFPFDDAADQAGVNPPFVDTGVIDAAFNIGTLWTYHYTSSSVAILFTSNNGGVTGSDFNGPIHTAEPVLGNKLTRGGVTHYGVDDAGNAIFELGRRYLPSLLLARMFDEVFPYSIVQPQHNGSAYADLSATGNLLIRGGTTTGNVYGSLADSSDYIALSLSGSQLKVDVAIGNPVPGSGADMTLSHYFNIADISSIHIEAGDGADLVFINYVPADVTMNVELGDGNDTIVVGGGDFDTNIFENVNIDGGNGFDSVQMDDSDDTGADGYHLSYLGISKTSTVPYARTNLGVEALYLTANGANNVITVAGTASYQVDIHAGAGNDTITNDGATLNSTFDNTTIYGEEGTDTIHLNDSSDLTTRVWTIGSLSISRTGFGPWLYFTTEALVIDGNDAVNTYDIVALNSSTTLTINAGDGDDQFNVGATNRDLTIIDGNITLAGGLGTDSLHVDDRDGPGGGLVGAIYNITSTTFQSVGNGLVTFSSMAELTVDGNAFGDLFNVDGTSSLTAVTLNGNGDNDLFDITSGDVDNAIDGVPTLNGGAGDDVINYNDQNDTGDDVYNISSTNITKRSGRTIIADLVYSSIQMIDVDASAGNSTISVDSLGKFNFPGFNLPTDLDINAGAGDDDILIGDGTMLNMYGDVTVAGGDGVDNLIVDDSANTGSHDWIVTNTYVDRNPGTLTTYGTVETLLVMSGEAADDIQVLSDAVPTSINGGDGDDTFTIGAGNLATVLFPITINGEAGIDAITLNDSIYNFSTFHVLTPTLVTRSFFGGMTYATAELLTLLAPNTAGTVDVNGTAPETPVIIYPNNGTDAIHVNETAPTAPVTVKNSLGNDNVEVNNDGGGFAMALFDETISLNSLTLANNGVAQVVAGGGRVLRLMSLSMSKAILDLTDNDLIIQSTSANEAAVLTMVNGLIGTGRAAGAWTGNGIVSTAAQANPSRTTGLAAISNDDGRGGTIKSTFDGQTVDGDTILVKYTYDGDSNLDGDVDADDYARMDAGFASRGNPGFQSIYRNGNLNYIGSVNSDDYFLIDRAFSGQGAPLATAAVAEAPTNALAASANAPATSSAAVAPAQAPAASSLTITAQQDGLETTAKKTRRKRHHSRHGVPDLKLGA